MGIQSAFRSFVKTFLVDRQEIAVEWFDMSARSADRRKMIVAAARARFTMLGYDGTTIGDLAAELGISKAAIAYYFPTKETFLDELVTPFIDALEQGVGEAAGPRDVASAYLSAIVAHHDLALWIDTDPAIQSNPRFGGRLNEINTRVTKSFTGRSRRKSDAIRALGVLGGLWRPARELPVVDLVGHFDEIVDAASASY